jgi:hypothetical protein
MKGNEVTEERVVKLVLPNEVKEEILYKSHTFPFPTNDNIYKYKAKKEEIGFVF